MLEQEATRLQKEVDANQAKVKECREKPGGCDAQVEQGMELLIKRDVDELERRAKADSTRATELIYRCLYDHHVTQEHIPPMFATKANKNLLSLKTGCNNDVKTKLSEKLYACICDEYAGEHQEVEKNIARLHKVEAGNKLAAATEEFRKKQEAETTSVNQKAAETAEAKLVMNVVKDSPQYRDILKHLQDGNTNVTRVQEDARAGEAAAEHAEAHLHARLDKCLSHHIEDKSVQNNLRAAFHDTGGVGNENSAACVLLSMSKDPVVVQAHQCICLKDPTTEVKPVESDFAAMSALQKPDTLAEESLPSPPSPTGIVR